MLMPCSHGESIDAMSANARLMDLVNGRCVLSALSLHLVDSYPPFCIYLKVHLASRAHARASQWASTRARVRLEHGIDLPLEGARPGRKRGKLMTQVMSEPEKRIVDSDAGTSRGDSEST